MLPCPFQLRLYGQDGMGENIEGVNNVLKRAFMAAIFKFPAKLVQTENHAAAIIGLVE